MKNADLLNKLNQGTSEFAQTLKFRVSKGIVYGVLGYIAFILFFVFMAIFTSKGSRSLFTKKGHVKAEIIEIRESTIIRKHAIYSFYDQFGQNHIDSIHYDEKWDKKREVGEKIDIIYDSNNPESFHIKDDDVNPLVILIPICLLSLWFIIPFGIEFKRFTIIRAIISRGKPLVAKIVFIKEQNNISIFPKLIIIAQNDKEEEIRAISYSKWLVNSLKVGDEVVIVHDGKNGALPIEYIYN